MKNQPPGPPEPISHNAYLAQGYSLLPLGQDIEQLGQEVVVVRRRLDQAHAVAHDGQHMHLGVVADDGPRMLEVRHQQGQQLLGRVRVRGVHAGGCGW